jgi:cobalamin biosynthesis Mg chelatase CobN
MSALLAGPDEKRFKAALMMGNNYGFTDRLDYIFLKNGAKVLSSAIVGNTWPQGSTWACSNEEQINNAALMADVMKVEMPPTRFCNDTDHASVVTQLSLPSYSEESDPLDPHSPFPISFWNWVGILLLISLSGIIYLRKRRI